MFAYNQYDEDDMEIEEYGSEEEDGDEEEEEEDGGIGGKGKKKKVVIKASGYNIQLKIDEQLISDLESMGAKIKNDIEKKKKTDQKPKKEPSEEDSSDEEDDGFL